MCRQEQDMHTDTHRDRLNDYPAHYIRQQISYTPQHDRPRYHESPQDKRHEYKSDRPAPPRSHPKQPSRQQGSGRVRRAMPLRSASRRQRGLSICIPCCNPTARCAATPALRDPRSSDGAGCSSQSSGRQGRLPPDHCEHARTIGYDQHHSVQYLPLPKNLTYHVGDEGASTQTARRKRRGGERR